MLASGAGAAPGAPLRTVGGWKTGAPPALGAPPAAGLDLRFILGHYLGMIPSSGMMDWGWISSIVAGD